MKQIKVDIMFVLLISFAFFYANGYDCEVRIDFLLLYNVGELIFILIQKSVPLLRFDCDSDSDVCV